MQDRFNTTLRAINPEGKVLLAVSGGIDSMCMAHLFLHSDVLKGGMFEVAHCNFSLRGEESDADESLVEKWCRNNCVPFHSTRFDTTGYAEQKGISIEMAARELRYGWFANLAKEHGFCAVAVAHNANDNAETLLLNLVRGTGIKGILGMSFSSPLPYPGTDVRLIRPLIQFPRKDIFSFAENNNIPFREDRTNSEDAYKRNKLRHNVIPVLEEINPSVLSTLYGDMEHFREVSGIADDYFLNAMTRISSTEKSGDGILITKIDRSAVLKEKFPHYILHRIMTPLGFTGTQVKSLETIIGEREGTFSGKTLLAENGRIITSGNSIIIYRYCKDSSTKKESTSDVIEGCVEMDINTPGRYSLDGILFSVEVIPWGNAMNPKQPQGTIIFDKAKADFPLHLRHWFDGDWIRPLGMKGRKKKLSDLFTDLGLSLIDKENILVISGPDKEISYENGEEKTVVPDSEIMAVVGYRISDDVKVTGETSSVIRITVRPE